MAASEKRKHKKGFRQQQQQQQRREKGVQKNTAEITSAASCRGKKTKRQGREN